MDRISIRLNTLDIFKWIVNHDSINRNDYTIIITGRVGPTGKTWLCNELCKIGFRAMENTQFTMSQLLKDDGMNHVIHDENVKQVIVVLNEILPMYENRWRKISNFDSTDLYIFKTRAEAEDIRYKMIRIAEEYGVVTRGDFNDMLDLNGYSDDHKRGWTLSTIRKSRIISHTCGYFIEFPKAVIIM